MEDKRLKIDIGCGRNKKEGFVGVDVDVESDADVIASALDLPFEADSVSEINSSHLVEHFSPEELRAFFNEIHRVLRRGGIAFLKVDRDWTKSRLLKKDMTHKYRYSVREIKKILRGFSKTKVVNKIYLINDSVIGFVLRNKIFVTLEK